MIDRCSVLSHMMEQAGSGGVRASHFADETHTGAENPVLRGTRKVIVAARCWPGLDDFDWINRFRRDYCADVDGGELKSSVAIAISEHNERAREFLVRHVCESQVYVIDLFADYYQLLSCLSTLAPDPFNMVKSIAATNKIPESIIRELLSGERARAVFGSIVPQIEWLLTEAKASYPDPQNDPLRLFTEDELGKLNDQQLRELITRFTVLFAEAMNPQVRAQAIMATLATQSDRQYIALQVLEHTVSHDVIFDVSASGVMPLLQKADGMIQQCMTSISTSALTGGQRSVREEDSRAVLGVQAADIAAGYARSVFERVFDGDTQKAAKKLREEFGRVLFNTRWL